MASPPSPRWRRGSARSKASTFSYIASLASIRGRSYRHRFTRWGSSKPGTTAFTIAVPSMVCAASANAVARSPVTSTPHLHTHSSLHNTCLPMPLPTPPQLQVPPTRSPGLCPTQTPLVFPQFTCLSRFGPGHSLWWQACPDPPIPQRTAPPLLPTSQALHATDEVLCVVRGSATSTLLS